MLPGVNNTCRKAGSSVRGTKCCDEDLIKKCNVKGARVGNGPHTRLILLCYVFHFLSKSGMSSGDGSFDTPPFEANRPASNDSLIGLDECGDLRFCRVAYLRRYLEKKSVYPARVEGKRRNAALNANALPYR